MTVKQVINLFDNWNMKLRINDEESAKPIVEYEHIYTFVYDDKDRDRKFEYLLHCEVIAFGVYNNTFCIRVKEK